MFQNGQLTVINMQDILPNRFQPRIRFDEEKLEELSDSISKYGVIQPIVVRPVGNKFEIIAGERRFKASKLASKATIPAIIVNLSDKDSEEIALLENVQRQELSPIEEAVSYKRILDMGYITQEELARKIGKSQSTIANKIRLLNLDDEVQSYLLNNKISERHARSLLRIPDKEKQVEMLHRIVEERLTVKQTDKEIEKLREEESQKVHKPIDLNVSVKSLSKNDSSSVTEEIENLFDEEEGENNMDIDKIMREAKDINENPAPAPKDISNLMVPGAEQKEMEPAITEQPILNNDLDNNKFINVAPTSEEKTSSFQNSNNSVTFDSMFNQHITPVNNVASESVVTTPLNNEVAANSDNLNNPANDTLNNSVNPINMDSANGNVNDNLNNDINNVSEVNNFSSIPDVNSTLEPNSISQNNESSNLSSNISNSMNVENNANDNFQNGTLGNVTTFNAGIENSEALNNSINNNVTGLENNAVNNSTAIPEISKSEIDNSFNQMTNIYTQKVDDEISDDTKKSISAAVSQALKRYNEDKARRIIASTIPTPTEKTQQQINTVNEELASQPTIPDMDIIAGNSLNEYANNVKPVNNQAPFADIVKLLRDCADKIEQGGYFVNVDELDLGNQYKVTFTINKD